MSRSRRSKFRQEMKLVELRNELANTHKIVMPTRHKYKIYDTYDYWYEVIGYADIREEVDKIIDQRIADTDGECFIVYTQLELSKDGLYETYGDLN